MVPVFTILHITNEILYLRVFAKPITKASHTKTLSVILVQWTSRWGIIIQQTNIIGQLLLLKELWAQVNKSRLIKWLCTWLLPKLQILNSFLPYEWHELGLSLKTDSSLVSLFLYIQPSLHSLSPENWFCPHLIDCSQYGNCLLYTSPSPRDA